LPLCLVTQKKTIRTSLLKSRYNSCMSAARFLFQPDLNQFLPAQWRSGLFSISFTPGQTVKHLIESAGLPHTEIGQILVDGKPVDFNYQVKDGDLVTVLPPAAGQDIPSSGPRFVLDNHLGRLAAYLRMLGLDVLYRNDFQDEELAFISSQQNRILLTRDRRLLMRKQVLFGCCLRGLDSREQLVEIIQRYRLAGQITPFQRCLRCNTPLEPVQKEVVIEFLEPLTRQYYDEFQRCPACGQIYWKGSHYEHMLAMIGQLPSGSG
jgi:uncharacterized protein